MDTRIYIFMWRLFIENCEFLIEIHFVCFAYCMKWVWRRVWREVVKSVLCASHTGGNGIYIFRQRKAEIAGEWVNVWDKRRKRKRFWDCSDSIYLYVSSIGAQRHVLYKHSKMTWNSESKSKIELKSFSVLHSVSCESSNWTIWMLRRWEI